MERQVARTLRLRRAIDKTILHALFNLGFNDETK